MKTTVGEDHGGSLLVGSTPTLAKDPMGQGLAAPKAEVGPGLGQAWVGEVGGPRRVPIS